MNRNRIDCFALHRGSADALYFSARIRLFFQPTRKESSGHAEDTFFGAISASGFESLKARILMSLHKSLSRRNTWLVRTREFKVRCTE